jgi:hypothetical protein
MTTIKLTSSELAIITGHNKYETKQKVIDKVLNRSGIVKKYIPKSKVEESLLSLPENELNVIKKQLKLDENSTVKDVEKFVNKTMNKSLGSNISENESREKVDEVLKNIPTLKCLESAVKQDIRMKRGNIKENSNLDKTQATNNIVIRERNSKMYERELYNDPEGKFNIIIRGKVDGMNEDIVVETKNRTKRLFNLIPEYEKVQLNSYMFLTGKVKSLHIECYNETQNSIEYPLDKLFWDDCCDKIIEFVKKDIVCHIK